jgi:methylenetetrahydrofolate dehydrogenase (NADP+) / methenyltetrahydrofolate cyclohydrolase
MNLIDGKHIAELIRKEIATEVATFIDAGKRAPHLAALLVGDDPASQSYVTGKQKACEKCGISSSIYRMPQQTTQDELLGMIDFLNDDPEVDGFIVQLPLPAHIDVNRIIAAIDPMKDVDGFHPMNVGRMVAGMDALLPATPKGIMELLRRYDIETEGKHCVIIGRSNIVGTPMSILLSRKTKPGNATVTLCHSRTEKLEGICASADILIAAIGSPYFVKANMVKDGAVVIDVGIHRIPDESLEKGYYICGDVDFNEVSKKASWITPVPNGVGPMTIAGLLLNTMQAYHSRLA